MKDGPLIEKLTPKEFVNLFFFGHKHDPTPEEAKANQDFARSQGLENLEYKDPSKVFMEATN